MIYKKLLDFQKMKITLKKSGVNPHYKSNYVELNEVMEKVKPVLNEMEIVIIQTPEKDGLRTYLYDTSDDTKIEGFLPFVQLADAQKMGSNLTYNRRYSLVTMLGLEDEDDDGNKAKNLGKDIPLAEEDEGDEPVINLRR